VPLTPEQRAREHIDQNLRVSGWVVQDRDDLDLTVGRGIAVREFRMKRGFGFADYLLYLDRQAIGAVEAKAEGTLTGVEAQSAKYAAGLPEGLPAHRRPLPFLLESNGSVTFLTNGLDPTPRSRQVFNFPRPETLGTWVSQQAQLRERLRGLPALDQGRLWTVQARAIGNLEASFAAGRPRALIQMATGSGKTYAAVTSAYRLLKYGSARRILFLVDRANLGKQAEDEFRNFQPSDDPRKFPELYTVQRLKRNSINPASKVVITTIQRLFSMLQGELEYDEGNEEASSFDAVPWHGEPPKVAYSATIPPEFFDFIVVDECHRSIYELWSQVLLYFDSFVVGLTATPGGKTIGFFNQNLVMQYGHEEAVADGVNVDFDVYRIRTRVTEDGATIDAGKTGVYVDRRDRLSRAERLELLKDDFTYTANQLDRDVVSESQLRTVLQEFRSHIIPEAFPDRAEVPKTLIFAKDDSHADDVVRLMRDVFDEGNDFCQKITYRTGFVRRAAVGAITSPGDESREWIRTSSLTADELLANFRNSYYPRVAVTVDMISTGTDVRPIECVFFLRNVKSAGFFEQMKGRGVRVISPDKLRAVTPSATVKDRFLIVDAVGVCEADKTDSQTLNRQPTTTLDQILSYVAQGGTDPEALVTLAGRMGRLQRQFDVAQLDELRVLAGGRTLADLAHQLLRACDPDAHSEAARELAGPDHEPTDEEVLQATQRLTQEAVEVFLRAPFRRRLLELRQQAEQTIDRHTVDEVLYSGFDGAAVEHARARVSDFRTWIEARKDNLLALQVLYSGTRPLDISLADLRRLRDALSEPPMSATPVQLWRAFEATEPENVRGSGGQQLADLVNLVRHALAPNHDLVPYRADLEKRYQAWLKVNQAESRFTPEQREWLDRIADHLATSLAIRRSDFELGWFSQHGSLGRAYAVFGRDLDPLLAELNEALAA
jgi:type I restriction enzyme R subunit